MSVEFTGYRMQGPWLQGRNFRKWELWVVSFVFGQDAGYNKETLEGIWIWLILYEVPGKGAEEEYNPDKDWIRSVAWLQVGFEFRNF